MLPLDDYTPSENRHAGATAAPGLRGSAVNDERDPVRDLVDLENNLRTASDALGKWRTRALRRACPVDGVTLDVIPCRRNGVSMEISRINRGLRSGRPDFMIALQAVRSAPGGERVSVSAPVYISAEQLPRFCTAMAAALRMQIDDERLETVGRNDGHEE